MENKERKSKLTKEGRSKHRQITDDLREKLLSGFWKPGVVLPTIHELAELYSTSYFTAQTALTPLVKEGLLERKRRVGTIVKHPVDTLHCVAIYCGGFLQNSHQDAFVVELCRQLKRQLTVAGVQVIMFMDTRSKEGIAELLPSLKRSVDENEVQAVIVARCDNRSMLWLRRLPVTMTFATNGVVDNRVGFDSLSLFREALGRLRDCGCERVGIICSTHQPRGAKRYEPQFYADYYRIIEELHLRTKPEWSDGPTEHQPHLEDYGYRRFHALWNLPERPEGMLIYPDVVARGALTAALELGVRVPEELKIVTHRNVGVDLVAPLAVDWVVSDVPLLASTLINQIYRQKSGEEVAPELLPYTICRDGNKSDNYLLTERLTKNV